MTELFQLNAADIAAKVSSGEVSATEVTENALQRLQQVNPSINAVIQEMPEQALENAKSIDRAIQQGNAPGILCGVPVTIKVNVDQQGYATTNGLRTLKDNVAGQDNPVVANLRKAGAIIIGRTNTPAFSMRWFTRNSLHGHTLNPRNPELTPGGSSGGAASSVASGICAIGHGTDIAGSIRFPAYACGINGLRPSLGRVPAVNRSLPDRHIGAQITAVSGPLARSVKDVELGFHAMSQTDYSDPWWVPVPHDMGRFARTAALCTHPDGMDTDPEIVKVLENSAALLKEAGWKVDTVECPPMREPMELQVRLWLSEFQLNKGAAVRAENDPDANFVFAQMMEWADPPTLGSFMEILQTRVRLVRDWQAFLEKYSVLICPNSSCLPFRDQLDVESPEFFLYVVEAQMTQIGIPFLGIPAMSVSTGMIGNSPVGVQLVAARFREDILFDAAATIESSCEKVTVSDP